MRLPAGSMLGPYEVTGLVGAGGMGEVYRARDTRLGREVAIKILPRQVAGDAERLARFEREARTASALNHPNIVTIHDFTARDGETWLVMELVRGLSLREVITSGPIPLKKLTTIAAAIASGLAAAHAAGIVHRDLKPENVMISDDGIPKILDFGLVKQARSGDLTNSPTEQHVSRAGVTLGTAAYMSPEQARGGDVDFRSDHFSLGIMLYEMATGRHPFRRASSFETLAAIVNDETPPLDAFPEPLASIIERCLAKNPEERYGSTVDLAYDLRRLPAIRGTPARKSPRWSAGVLAAAVVMVIALALAAAALRFRRAPDGIADPIQVDVAMPQILEVPLSEALVPLAISPNGRYLVVNGNDINGKSQLWLRDLHSGAVRLVADDAFAPAWSADGKAIAFFSGGKLKSVGLDGGPPRTICDADPQGTPSWRGDTILFGQYSFADVTRRGIYRVSASGGTPQLAVAASAEPLLSVPFWPELLPDGKHFLYISLNPDRVADIRKTLRVASLDGGEAREIPEVNSRPTYVNGWLLFVRDGTLMAQRFDPAKGLTGEPASIVDDVHYFRNTGLTAFCASQNGVLAWRSARSVSRLAWVDRGGIEVESVATAPFDPAGRLSNDGKRYAVGVIDPKQGVSDVWVYDLERGSAERVTFRRPDEKSPVWARDGRTLYCRTDGQGGPPDIVQFRPGDDQPSLLYRGPTVESPQDVSPDGKWLLFVSFFVGGSDIGVLPLDPPGPPRPFAATPFDETAPRFSPDGQWVAYASDLSGRPEVYVRPFEGSSAAKRISKDGGTRPRWRRDGKELYFLGAEGRVMVVPTGRDFGTPRLLFQAASAADFEPAPDGSRFLMQLQQDSMTPPVHLLVNWQARATR
jgi:Tol biopolymer transport system component